MSVLLGRFMESSSVVPPTKFSYRKANFFVCEILQSALESGKEIRIIQAMWLPLERANHHGSLYKLCSVGIGGSVIIIIIKRRRQYKAENE